MREHPTEAQIQVALVTQLRWRWQALPAEQRPFIFAIPNGGRRDPREAAHMLAQGVTAGLPDLQIVMPGGSVIWVELKAHNGVLRQSQKDIHAKLKMLGHVVHVYYGLDEAIAGLTTCQ